MTSDIPRDPRDIFPVRDFGAAADGRTLDTAAVQRAIDACAGAGGGMVYCGPGTYLIGTILLKSHVELHLEAGATLLGSPRSADYTTEHNWRLDTGYPQEKCSAAHLIYANGAKNIALTGRGTIDGHGRAFMGPLVANAPYPYFEVPGWRPGQLIAFYRCEDVLLRDVHIVDSPYWTIWPFSCDRVRVQGISICNNRCTPNGDGINPDCCRDVHISDCTIHAGDDCIAVRSDVSRVGDGNRCCESITVTNCTLVTPCTGVRLGFAGDAPIRNCVFSNLVMTNTYLGIDVLVPHVPSFGVERGPCIENISFSNIVMEGEMAFKLVIGDGTKPPAGIRNISISNYTAHTRRYSYIGGTPDIPVRDVRFHNLRLTMNGEPDPLYVDEVPYPWCYWGNLGSKGLPHAIYCRHARDIEFHDVRVDWGNVTGPWRTALQAESVERLTLDGFAASQPPTKEALAAVRLRNVRGAFLHGCRAEEGTRTFLQVNGDPCNEITTVANDLHHARNDVARH